jgi:hypothetical protein
VKCQVDQKLTVLLRSKAEAQVNTALPLEHVALPTAEADIFASDAEGTAGCRGA